MHTTVDVHIMIEGGGIEIVRKVVDLTLSLTVGTLIDDGAFPEAKPIKRLVVDLESRRVHVVIDGPTVDTAEEAKRTVKMFGTHGWASPGADPNA